MKEIVITLNAEGVPVSFELDGRTWVVGAEPVRWFERRSWWETDLRMGRQGEARRIDVAVWQLQARPERNPSSDLVTFEVVHDEVGKWMVHAQS
ncbi:hypothetical protein [Pseudarthrobacter chlorophenolicus]|uniref:hypothetical protein n=1 Tax=Pseudarthrobacter chlorophenolicus TaxID=85085 RepID=UPI0002FE79DE|nr:hypothetical protein [Pseudarthrobacter chlorophenolicus]